MNQFIDICPILLSLKHTIEFRLEQIVFLKTDPDKQPRMVVGISLRPNQSVTYCLALGASESWHYGIEIDSEEQETETFV